MKYIIILIFGLITIISNAQKYKIDIVELDRYEFANDKFINLIDSIIDVVSKCDYYSDSLLFEIRTVKEPGDSGIYLIRIDPFYKTEYILTMDPYGFINYKKHIFFLWVDLNNQLVVLRNKSKRKFIIKTPIYEEVILDRPLVFDYISFYFDGENFKFSCRSPDYNCPTNRRIKQRAKRSL